MPAPPKVAPHFQSLSKPERRPAVPFNCMSKLPWSLLHEIGTADAFSADFGARQVLHFPAYVARAQDGSYLIGDELAKEKVVPFRFESRTLRVGADGTIRFDSLAMGIHDGIGCLADDGSMAILCRTRWELQLYSSQGDLLDRFNLAAMSKRLPRFVTPTGQGTYLVSFFDRVGSADLVEVDRCGRLRWFLTLGPNQIGIAGCVQQTPGDTFLIADPVRHVVTEIGRDGSVHWQYGEAGQPSSQLHHLSSPNSACALPDGRRLIADTRNHRLLVIGQDGHARPIQLAEGGLCDPMHATMTEDGHLLIADTGNFRVIETDADGQTCWRYGNDAGTQRPLSYPRSVELLEHDRLLVADTAQDRIVEVCDKQIVERTFRGDRRLFWPRCARPLATGGVLVADGRNGRVVELDAEGTLIRELTTMNPADPVPFGDPHDVRLLPNGNLLVVDSMRDLVVEVDWTGHVYRAVDQEHGLSLRDPHSAQQLDDGSLLIADTSNHQILIVDRDGLAVHRFSSLQASEGCLRLSFPRYVEMIEDGTLVIADTGNNRVLAANLQGELLWEFSEVPDSKLRGLNQPRWVKWIAPDQLLICDHYHHRILHVQHAACDDAENERASQPSTL